MNEALLKKIVLIGLLIVGIGFALSGIIMIILKLNGRLMPTDYLSAVVFTIMGLFLIVLRSVLIKKKILD